MPAGILAACFWDAVHGIWSLIGYLSTGTFPHPLSEEEEKDCLERMKSGDPKAKDTLIERNMRLVAHITKKFDNTGEDMDDLISIGTIGLIKAIQSYDDTKGTRLATYAARCIENEILMHLRSRKKRRNEISIYDPIGTDREGNEITLADILGTDGDIVPDEVTAEFERRKVLEKIPKLGKKEREVILMRYGLQGNKKRTQREVAARLGISRSYVSRIEKKAVNKLLNELLADGFL